MLCNKHLAKGKTAALGAADCLSLFVASGATADNTRCDVFDAGAALLSDTHVDQLSPAVCTHQRCYDVGAVQAIQVTDIIINKPDAAKKTCVHLCSHHQALQAARLHTLEATLLVRFIRTQQNMSDTDRGDTANQTHASRHNKTDPQTDSA